MLNTIIPLAICMALLFSNSAYASDEQYGESRKRGRSSVTIEEYESLEALNGHLKQRIEGLELTTEELGEAARLNDFIKEGLYLQIKELERQNRKLLANAEKNLAHTDEGATPTKPVGSKLKRRNGVLDLGAYARALAGNNLRK